MASNRRRWISAVLTTLVAIAVVVGAMLWLSGAWRSGVISPAKLARPSEPYAGPTFTVQATTRPVEVDLVGSVESEVRTTLSGRMTARIVAMPVQSGDRVTRGQVLVQLDDRDVKTRVAQAAEALHAAEAVRDLARLEVDRLSPLVEQRVASPYELDQWKTRHAAATADVIRAQQVVREAEVAASDAVITAPFDAVVVDRLAEPGDMAAPGKPLLAIYDPARLRLDASVREAYIARLSQLRSSGQPIGVLITATGRQVSGLVRQIVPAADPLSRSFVVKVHLDDPTDLYPGMFGRLRVPMEQAQVVEVPQQAVREVGQLSLVRVIENGQVATRAVRLGHTRGDRVEVLAGLQPGEQLVAQ